MQLPFEKELGKTFAIIFYLTCGILLIAGWGYGFFLYYKNKKAKRLKQSSRSTIRDGEDDINGEITQEPGDNPFLRNRGGKKNKVTTEVHQPMNIPASVVEKAVAQRALFNKNFQPTRRPYGRRPETKAINTEDYLKRMDLNINKI